MAPVAWGVWALVVLGLGLLAWRVYCHERAITRQLSVIAAILGRAARRQAQRGEETVKMSKEELEAAKRRGEAR